MMYDFCVGVERKTVRIQPGTFSRKKRNRLRTNEGAQCVRFPDQRRRSGVLWLVKRQEEIGSGSSRRRSRTKTRCSVSRDMSV